MTEPAALDLAAVRDACENATAGPWRRGAMPNEDNDCVVTVALSKEYDGEPYPTSIVESSLCVRCPLELLSGLTDVWNEDRIVARRALVASRAVLVPPPEVEKGT